MEERTVTVDSRDQAKQKPAAASPAWRLYLPVVALVLFAVALAGGALWLAVEEIDRTAARSSSRLAKSAVEDLSKSMAVLAKDYAFWDVTIEKVLVDLDRTWAEDDLGTYMSATFGITGSLVIDENDRLVFFWRHPETPAFSEEGVERIVRDLAHVIEVARSTPMDVPEGVPGLVMAESGLAVAGVSAITPEVPSGENLVRRPRPVLILLRPLDAGWLAQTAERFALEDLRIGFAPAKGSEHAVDLFLSDGTRLAYLDWQTPRAGLRALRDLAVPSAVLLILALAAGAVVIRRGMQTQQAQIARAQDLASANADLVERDQQVRSALQRAEHATRAKSAFLARISHEIRTPLTAIIGFSQILKLQHRPNQEKTREQEYAEIIHESSQHLLALVNDLLDLSKIESGGFEINESWIDLSREIASIKTVLGVEADRKGVSLQVDLPDDVAALYADAKAVRQILTNLVSNALKFTPDGGRAVIRLRRTEEGGIVLSVADTGAGIDAQDQQTIWEPFTRSRNPALSQAEGTGLGLYLVKMLAELHGADISLESALGEGTVVAVAFGPERVRDVPV